MKTKVLPRHRESLLVWPRFERARDKVRSGQITRANHAGFARLLDDADQALESPLFFITDKLHVPPSGDKRDYFSLSIYFWPNENAPDGMPYVARDGLVNPEVEDYDRPRFVRMCVYVDALSLAYGLTGEERYAAKAAEFLRAWFVNDHTRMNPNMLFAQYIPGDNVVLPWKDYPARFVPGTGGRKGVYVSFGGVIEDLDLIPMTDCLALLRGSESWTHADHTAVVAWYAAYAQWLLTHQHGLDEAACRNNHASWYWADIFCFLNFTGQPERTREYAAQYFPERLAIQIEPDGSQPEELVRAVSKSYTAFTLISFTNMAVSAAEAGFDAWNFEDAEGRSLRKALDWLLPYLDGGKTWEWKQIKPFEEDRLAGQLAAATQAWNDPQYAATLAKLEHFAPDDPYRVIFDV